MDKKMINDGYDKLNDDTEGIDSSRTKG